MNIQGRAMPFDYSDQVSLGYMATRNGTYQIAIASLDGLFLDESLPVLLEDKILNIVHDLRQSPYSFETVSGQVDNRFVLKYANNLLGLHNLQNGAGEVVVVSNTSEIKITASKGKMETISVYDILGRQLFEDKRVNEDTYSIRQLPVIGQTLLVKVVFQNGIIAIKKIVH